MSFINPIPKGTTELTAFQNPAFRISSDVPFRAELDPLRDSRFLTFFNIAALRNLSEQSGQLTLSEGAEGWLLVPNNIKIPEGIQPRTQGILTSFLETLRAIAELLSSSNIQDNSLTTALANRAPMQAITNAIENFVLQLGSMLESVTPLNEERVQTLRVTVQGYFRNVIEKSRSRLEQNPLASTREIAAVVLQTARTQIAPYLPLLLDAGLLGTELVFNATLLVAPFNENRRGTIAIIARLLHLTPQERATVEEVEENIPVNNPRVIRATLLNRFNTGKALYFLGLTLLAFSFFAISCLEAEKMLKISERAEALKKVIRELTNRCLIETQDNRSWYDMLSEAPPTMEECMDAGFPD